jgi:hypothetical protein
MKKVITLIVIASFIFTSAFFNEIRASSDKTSLNSLRKVNEKLTFLYDIRGRHFNSVAEVNSPPTFMFHKEVMEEDTQMPEGIFCHTYQSTITLTLNNPSSQSYEDLLLEGDRCLKTLKKSKDSIQATVSLIYAAAFFDELLSREDKPLPENPEETYHSQAKVKLYEGLQILQEKIVLN